VHPCLRRRAHAQVPAHLDALCPAPAAAPPTMMMMPTPTATSSVWAIAGQSFY
jgi:hypothetical protein